MKLKDFAQICYGKNQHKVEVEHSEIPILGTGGIIGYASKPLYIHESVLIGRKGTLGKPFYIDRPFWTIDTLFYTRINKSLIIPRYFYYAMCSLGLERFAEGAAVPSLTTKTLNEIEIPVPTMSEQQHIVDIIGTIDDLIEKKRATIAKIDQLAQKLFDTGFGLSHEEKYSLNQICSFVPGYSYKSDELKPSSLGMVSLKCISMQGGFRGTGVKALQPVKEISKEKMCNIGDVLVCHTDLTKNQEIIGRPIIVPNKGKYKTLTFSMDLVKVNVVDKRFNNALIYRILNCHLFKKHALGFCSGTTVVHLSKQALQSYQFYGPSKFEKVSGVLQNYQNLIELLALELNALEQQKQILLFKYFSSN